MPDAWEDDWISETKPSTSTPEPAVTTAKQSKAERRRQQAEFNRQIWEKENSENPNDNYFLQSKGVVPLQSEFKPQMKVLSRKPTKPSTSADPNSAMSGLSIEDEDDDEDSSKDAMTPEERLKKAQKERDEKQKAYEERRRQLFGNDGQSTTTKASPKTGPPRSQSRAKANVDSRPSSAASNKIRQLFDPNEATKPENLRPQSKPKISNEIHPIREPKAPDGSGRGGFGFSPRGGRNS